MAASGTGARGSPATSACCGRRAAAAFRSAAPIRLSAPLIDPNFLGEADDLETMVAGFKTTRRLMETPALRALQKKDMFTEGVRTDDDIRNLLRARVDTVYHPVGTAKMGVNDPMAVVDPKLKVYGVEGPARGRCFGDADADRRQHQCADDHDRREGRRHDQGGDAGGMIAP